MPNPGSCLCVRVGGEGGRGRSRLNHGAKKFDDEGPGGLFELRY